MSFSPDVSRDWKMASMSPGPEDFGRFRIENNQLKLQVKQLTVDLQSEQGKLNTGSDKQKNQRKIVNIFLSTNFNVCFGCSNEPSH